MESTGCSVVAGIKMSTIIDALRKDEIHVEIRQDGYVNATKLAQSGSKAWADYYRSERFKSLLQLLLDEAQESTDSNSSASVTATDTTISDRTSCLTEEHFVQINTKGPNHTRGTWIHPNIAVDCAHWVSPTFAFKVSQLVWRWSTGQVTTEESQAAAAQLGLFGTETPQLIARHEKLLRTLGQERGGYAALIGEGLGKIGRADKSFASRMQQHQSFFPTFCIFSLVPCSNPYLLERRVLEDPAVRPYRTKYRGQVEMVKFTPDGLTPTKLSGIMEEHAANIERGTQLALAKEATKQEQSRENQELARMKQAEERTKQLAIEERIELARLRASSASPSAGPSSAPRLDEPSPPYTEESTPPPASPSISAILRKPTPTVKPPKKPSVEWTPAEIQALDEAVLQHGYVWKNIKANVPALSRHFGGMALRDKCVQQRRKAKSDGLDLTTFKDGAYKNPIPGKDDDLYESVINTNDDNEEGEGNEEGEQTSRVLVRKAKRVPVDWTDDEYAALKLGVLQHRHNWRAIKKTFPVELARHLGGTKLRDKVVQIRRAAKKEGLDLQTYQGGAFREPVDGKE